MKHIVTYNPYELFNVDPFTLLDSVFSRDSGNARELRSPAVDIRETASSFVIEAELPGLTESDIDLKVERGTLVMSAGKGTENKEESDKFLRRERSAWNFSRSFGLPESADENGITASFKNGVLFVEIPKKPEAEPKKIAVKAA